MLLFLWTCMQGLSWDDACIYDVEAVIVSRGQLSKSGECNR